MLKVGVFGVGHLGKIHLNNWKEIEGVELIGFFDPSPENAKEVNEKEISKMNKYLNEYMNDSLNDIVKEINISKDSNEIEYLNQYLKDNISDVKKEDYLNTYLNEELNEYIKDYLKN